MKDIQNSAYDISRLDRLGQLETGESESMHKLASKSHPTNSWYHPLTTMN
jgi:hypothetical protein